MDEINRAATAMTAQQKIKHSYFITQVKAMFIKVSEWARLVGGLLW